MDNGYEKPTVGTDNPNDNGVTPRSIVAASIAFVYGIAVFDILVFINWGGSVNLVGSKNAVWTD